MSSKVRTAGSRFCVDRGLILLGAAFLVGMGMATAAIGLAPTSAIDPGLRTLTAQSDVSFAPAFGQSDQSCSYATMANAKRQHRQVVCAE